MATRPAARANSQEFMAKVAHDAIMGIKPPKHCELRNCDLPYWKDITDARFNWTEVDLAHAVNLARCLADIAINQLLLDKEGYVRKNKNGPVRNPRHGIIKDLIHRAVQLSCKLQVHAAATIDDIDHNRYKNAAKQKAVSDLADLAPEQKTPAKNDEDSLIARPRNPH